MIGEDEEVLLENFCQYTEASSSLCSSLDILNSGNEKINTNHGSWHNCLHRLSNHLILSQKFLNKAADKLGYIFIDPPFRLLNASTWWT